MNINRRSWPIAYVGFNSTDQTGLRDIKQLLRDLYENKDEKNDDFWNKSMSYPRKDWVTYTVYINEFYYDKNPRKKNESEDAEWRDFVNCDNRQMHILCNTEFSKDEQSSLTTSNIMISQRSIKTIFNKNLPKSELATAWGIETKSEHEALNAKRNGDRSWIYKQETKTNGRYNTFSWLNDARNWSWDNYIDPKNNKIKDNVRAQYACLLRNRDLNGNKKIDANEVRWYLPATNQYVGLWIGQDALPAEARLLQKSISDITTANLANNHYLSSNGVRFWAEEGVATGSEAFIKFNVRCARNLGFNHPENESAPSDANAGESLDYVIKTMNSNVVTSIDLSRVDPSALRTGENKFTTLDLHGEHTSGSLNYPYMYFNVHTANSTANIKIEKDDGVIKKVGCPVLRSNKYN